MRIGCFKLTLLTFALVVVVTGVKAQSVQLNHDELYENASFLLIISTPESLVDVQGLDSLEGNVRLLSSGPAGNSFSGNNRGGRTYHRWYRYATGSKGEFTIGPFVLQSRGASWDVGAVEGTIIPPPDFSAKGRVKTQNRRLNEQLEPVMFTTLRVPEEVYYGEPFELGTMLYVNQAGLRAVFRQGTLKIGEFDSRADPSTNPALLGAEQDSTRVYSLGRSAPRELRIGGETFLEYLVAESPVVAVQSGKATLSGASLVLDPPLQVRFFGDFPSIPLEAPSAEIMVRNLPARPDDVFGQVVGQVTLGEMSTDRRELEEGDPLTLTVVVSGKGLLGGLSLEDLPDIPGLEPFPGSSETNVDIVRPDNPFLQQARLTRTYRAVHAGEIEIPPVRLAVFDPRTGKQTIQTTEAPSLRVASREGSVRTVDEGIGEDPDRPGARVIGNESVRHISTAALEGPVSDKSGKPLYRHPVFIGGNCALLLAACLIWGTETRKRRIADDPRRNRAWRCRRRAAECLDQMESLSKESERTGEVYAALAQSIREAAAALGEREASGLTNEEIDELLAGHGLDTGDKQAAAALLAKCDTIRYAPVSSTQDVQADMESARRLVQLLLKESI